MSVRGHIEGGGTFELTDEYVAHLRYFYGRNHHPPENVSLVALAAALPPEPYEPKVGDRVQYQIYKHKWSKADYEYRGGFEGHPVIRDLTHGGLLIVNADTALRPATEADR